MRPVRFGESAFNEEKAFKAFILPATRYVRHFFSSDSGSHYSKLFSADEAWIQNILHFFVRTHAMLFNDLPTSPVFRRAFHFREIMITFG